MINLLMFNRLLTPSIIKFVYYFGVVLSFLASIGIIISGFKAMEMSIFLGLGTIVGGLIAVLAGIVFSRIFTEIILVLFMIRDELVWQRQNRTSPSASTD